MLGKQTCGDFLQEGVWSSLFSIQKNISNFGLVLGKDWLMRGCIQLDCDAD